jgi:hypothetical protein
MRGIAPWHHRGITELTGHAGIGSLSGIVRDR